jgi:hypothetical protein
MSQQPFGDPDLAPPPPEGGGRRRTFLIVAIGLALALVAVEATFLLAGAGSPPARSGLRGSTGSTKTSLALAFQRSQVVTYEIHITMDGTVKIEGFGAQDLTMQMNETVSWKTVKVGADGVATVRGTVREVSGVVNGVAMPVQNVPQSMTMRITPDGRILTAGGVTITAVSGSRPSEFPGMGQMTPILPDRPVQPGDTWHRTFSQRIPFAEGALRYTTDSTFLRYQEMAGVRSAVIETKLDLPLRFTIGLGKLLRATGPSGSEVRQLRDASIRFGGHGAFTMTSWVDPATKSLLKSSSRGRFDMTMTFLGVPEGPDTFGFEGTFTQDLVAR